MDLGEIPGFVINNQISSWKFYREYICSHVLWIIRQCFYQLKIYLLDLLYLIYCHIVESNLSAYYMLL